MSKTVSIIVKDNGVVTASISEVITHPTMTSTLDGFITEHIGGRPDDRR